MCWTEAGDAHGVRDKDDAATGQAVCTDGRTGGHRTDTGGRTDGLWSYNGASFVVCQLVAMRAQAYHGHMA